MISNLKKPWIMGLLVALLATVGCSSGSSLSTPSLPGPPSLPVPPKAPSPPSAPAQGSQAPKPENKPPSDSDKAAENKAPSGTEGATEKPAAKPPGPEGPPLAATDPPIPEGARTSAEKEAELDRKLEASLAEFDELMKEDRERIDRRRATAPPAGGASGGSGGSGAFGGGGLDGEGEAGGEGDTGGEGEAAASQAGSAGEGDSGSSPGGAIGDSGTRGTEAPVPANIPDGDDDDIVARQLREAAMAEKDPELRERLWQEYRDYKSGAKRKKSDGDSESAQEDSP